MNDVKAGEVRVDSASGGAQEYLPPVVRVMSEAEVLSAFQVNAAGTMAWWVA